MAEGLSACCHKGRACEPGGASAGQQPASSALGALSPDIRIPESPLGRPPHFHELQNS